MYQMDSLYAGNTKEPTKRELTQPAPVTALSSYILMAAQRATGREMSQGNRLQGRV